MKVAGDQGPSNGRYSIRSFVDSNSRKVLTRRNSGHFPFGGFTAKRSIVNGEASGPKLPNGSGLKSGSSTRVISSPAPIRTNRMIIMPRPKSMPDLMAAAAAANANGMPPLPKNASNIPENPDRSHSISHSRPSGKGDLHGASNGRGRPATSALRSPSSTASGNINGASSEVETLRVASREGDSSTYALVNGSRASVASSLQVGSVTANAADRSKSSKNKSHRALRSTAGEGRTRILTGAVPPSWIVPPGAENTGTAGLDSSCFPPSSDGAGVSAEKKCFGSICAIERRARSLSASRRSSRTSRSSSPSSSCSGTSHRNGSRVGEPFNGTKSPGSNDTSYSSRRRRSSSFGRRLSRTSSGSSTASSGNNGTSPTPGEEQTYLGPAIEAAEAALAAASAAESPESNHPAKHLETDSPASASPSDVRSNKRVALSPGDGAVSRNYLQSCEPASTKPQVCAEPALNLPLSLNDEAERGIRATVPGQAGRWETKNERVSILRPPPLRPQGSRENRDECQDSSPSTRGGKAACTVCPSHDSDDESGFSSEYESDDEDKAKRSERQSSANHADGVGVSSRVEERKLSFGNGTSRAAATVCRNADGVKIDKIAPADIAKGGGGDVPEIRVLMGSGQAGRTNAVPTSEVAWVGAGATVSPMLTTIAAFRADSSEATSSADGGERKPSTNEGDEQRAGLGGGGDAAQERSKRGGGDVDGLPRLLSTPGRLSSGSSSSRPSFASRLGGGDGSVEAFAIARGRADDIRSLASGRAAAELGGLLRQAILGDWHTCAMPKRAPPRWKVEERAEWDAWVASEGVTKSEAMRIFTAAVNDLYRQNKEAGGIVNYDRIDEGIWPSPDKNASRDSSNTNNIKIDVNSKMGDSSVGGLALSAAPLFAGPVSISPVNDRKGPRKPKESAPSPPAGTTSSKGANSRGLPGSEVAVEEVKEDAGWRRGPGAVGAWPSSGSFRDGDNVPDVSGAAPAAVEAKDGPTKAGVLYKKREVLPGWRPRTFMLDARQRLLRYYLPSSARPRGSIPLEGCAVGTVVVGSEGKGESGPEGRRLFRIKLVAGPAPVSSGKGGGDDGRKSFLGSPAGDIEGFRKTHVLAATSPEEAEAWVTAIKDAAVYQPPPPVEIPVTHEVDNNNNAATAPGRHRTSNTRREDRSFENGRNGSESLAASPWPAASNNGSKNTVRAAHGRDAVVRAEVTSRQIHEQYEPAVCASMVSNYASATAKAGSGAEEGDKGGVGSAGSKSGVRAAAIARWKPIAAVATGAPLIVYVAAPVAVFLFSSISSNGGSSVSVIVLAVVVAMAAALSSTARARQQSRRVARWDRDQSTSKELDLEEDEDSQRYTVGFSIDVQSLQAELDRLRQGGVHDEQETWKNVSGSSVPPGVGSRGTQSMAIAGDAGDAKGTSWQHGSSASSVSTGCSGRGEGFGRAVRSDRSRTAEATGSSPPAATASVTVLHLVMKAAADSLLEVMPHLFIPRSHESITQAGRGSSVGSLETSTNAYANGSARANLGGVQSGYTGSREDERRRHTRVACVVTRTPVGGTGDGREGTAGVRGGRALVVVESAEAKSAGAIATEIAAAAAASLGSTRRELLAARLRSEVASTSSGLGVYAGFTSDNNADSKRVPLLHPEDTALAAVAVCRSDAPGQQASGQTVGMRFAGTAGVPDTRAFGENSPEEHRTWWLEALTVRRAELSAEKKRQNGVPLLHADDVASLARSGNGGCSERGSQGGARKMTARADCLVEIKSSATPPSSSSKRSSSNNDGDRSQRGRVRFAENTCPGRDGCKPSTAKRSSLDPTDLLELEDEREGEEQPLEVAVIPDPGGDGVASALRVTVGPVSALKGSERGDSAGGGGPKGVGSGKAGAPVIVLQVSVVGAGRIGAAVTLEFAEVLRRRLLTVDPSD